MDCGRRRILWMWPVALAMASVLGCSGLRSTEQPIVVKRTQMQMGTLVSITAVAPTAEGAQAAVTAGFAEIKRLERLLSTWRADSELSTVNQAAGHHPVRVSPDTMEVVARSLDMARLTEGGFNIAVGPAVDAWSVTERQRVPSAEELRALHDVVDWRRVEIDRAAQTIFLPAQGMRLDVGGIGKGFAADKAVEVLRTSGAQAGVVALSGDIKTFGDLPGMQGFPVGIRHPRQEDALVTRLDLRNEAISTAGDYERFFEQDGVRYHHILDPVTLEPARLCQSVTVIAPEGTVADGLDTGIFVLGPERGMALVERLPGVDVIIIDADGRMTVSPGLRARLRDP